MYTCDAVWGPDGYLVTGRNHSHCPEFLLVALLPSWQPAKPVFAGCILRCKSADTQASCREKFHKVHSGAAQRPGAAGDAVRHQSGWGERRMSRNPVGKHSFSQVDSSSTNFTQAVGSLLRSSFQLLFVKFQSESPISTLPHSVILKLYRLPAKKTPKLLALCLRPPAKVSQSQCLSVSSCRARADALLCFPHVWGETLTWQPQRAGPRRWNGCLWPERGITALCDITKHRSTELWVFTALWSEYYNIGLFSLSSFIPRCSGGQNQHHMWPLLMLTYHFKWLRAEDAEALQNPGTLQNVQRHNFCRRECNDQRRVCGKLTRTFVRCF